MHQYLPLTDDDRRELLEKIGVKRFDELIRDIPENVRLDRPLSLPGPLSEMEVEEELRSLSKENKRLVSFMGAGAYDHFIPSAVFTIASRSEFVTSYTPYQAEVSQGTLQVMYEYQSLICRLTGMEVANSSMYDGASALAEAALMALRIKKDRRKILYSQSLHPLWERVLLNYLHGLDVAFYRVRMEEKTGRIDLGDLEAKLEGSAALILSHPNFFGVLEDVETIAKVVKEKGSLLVVAFDPLSLGILKPPGDYGADIAVAEGQPLGIPLSFGGPYLGIFASKREYIRQMPGRMAGKTVDRDGNRGFVMALQTREQHIRREKATSNICTNQNLCALHATVYLSLMGKEGLRKVAILSLQRAHYLKDRLQEIPGVSLTFNSPFFKEFTVTLPKKAEEVFGEMEKRGFYAGVPLSWFGFDENLLLIAVTEKLNREVLDNYVYSMKEVLG